MAYHVMASMVASGVLDGLVLLVFAFRLWIRITMQRVGWEDIWATVAFLCGTLNAASDWVYLVGLGAGQPSITPAMWVYMFTFTCIVWAVRISIIYSILRIIPIQERLYTYGRIIITFFLFCCLALIIQKAIECNYAYHVFTETRTPFARCNRLHTMSISELAGESVGSFADVITVVFPLYVLRSLTLSARYLCLLRFLFSLTILVSVVCSIGLAFRIVPPLSRWSTFVTDFQIATCLIVCNLLVVVTYLYRVLGFQKRQSEHETSGGSDDPSAAESASRQMSLTTIDLLFSMHTAAGDRMSVGTGTVVREV